MQDFASHSNQFVPLDFETDAHLLPGYGFLLGKCPNHIRDVVKDPVNSTYYTEHHEKMLFPVRLMTAEEYRRIKEEEK